MSDNLLKTPLYDLHVELGAKMVGFAGYSMPVQYPLGVLNEHLHTRSKAGLFDVSHMGQIIVRGNNPAKVFESLVPVDVLGIEPFTQRYALFTNDKGGILDDLMISNAGDHLFVVVNAACKEQDFNLIQAGLGDDYQVTMIKDRALIALQGPEAAAVMERMAPETKNMVFMDWKPMTIAGFDCFIGRAGYTGEDGFEISVPNEHAEALTRLLLAESEVEAIGLGARDSLRLEAGLCLYGHDLSDETTPVEASLLWAMQKVRRADGERAGGFPGADVIDQQLKNGVTQKRVGFLIDGRAPVREGAEIKNHEGEIVGKVTSGSYGPTLKKPIAMGYVKKEFSKLGTDLFAVVRGRDIPVTVAKCPLFNNATIAVKVLLIFKEENTMSLKFTADHEWVRIEDNDTVAVGITDHAQNQLGDIVFVELPGVDDEFSQGDDVCVIESVKAASELKAPVSGSIVSVNEDIVDEPNKVNDDPLGDGWFIRLKLSNPSELDELLDESAYNALLD